MPVPHSYPEAKERVKEYFGTADDPPSVSTLDWFKSRGSSNFGRSVVEYIKSLFPFIQWLPRYNLTWLAGDLIAGITVGMVLVPQSLSYAKLAQLPPEYGLYSSFIGVLTYAFFATSKDVSIGPVAVMSLATGNVVIAVQDKFGDMYSAPAIATCLAFICGFAVLAIGLLRIGWLVEFIPQPAVSGFMTGSAINIAAGQVPALFGIKDRLDTRAATYEVIINTFKNLRFSTLDAAYGVTALVTLYTIKWSLQWASNRYPKFARPAFFLQAFRHALVIIIWTIIAWRTQVGRTREERQISLVGTVPAGLQHMGPPLVNTQLLGAIGPHIPVATIVLLLEHISIAKSFGRLNGYKINPNQELIAIGVNNTLGTLFNAYPSTGSFSRSALKSKSGVRTPAAGIPTGMCVIIALYALAPAFYYIPNAALSALIIHAVADLVASPKQSFGFWRVSPLEYIIFVGAVMWSIFYSIEAGIYWSLATSIVLLLFRIARPKGHFLGRVRIQPGNLELGAQPRDVYVPLCSSSGVTNRDVKVEAPPPGIIIYRFEESFLYPNASYINDRLVEHVKQVTRRGKDMSNISKGDRPWNDPGPKAKDAAAIAERDSQKPLCKAVVLDFAAVANLDTTGVQNLIDTRKEVEKWADRRVEFHFCGILSPWIRRALIAGGFGVGRPDRPGALEVAPVVPQDNSRAPAPGESSFPPRQSPSDEESDPNSSSGSSANSLKDGLEKENRDPQIGNNQSSRGSISSAHSMPLLDRSTPFFHFDLADALNSLGLTSRAVL